VVQDGHRTGTRRAQARCKLGRGHFLRAAEEYLPTGGQFGIVHGDQSAIVTEVGATLRSFSVAGLELLVTFGVETMDPSHGFFRSTPATRCRKRTGGGA
jgi:hypothetical protein